MSIKSLLCALIFLATAYTHTRSTVFSLMLDPAGDAKYTGRVIDNNFERGITLQCAQELKRMLEHRNHNVRVILTRLPGETLDLLQNASFANRLDVDLYVSIHFFQISDDERPHLYMYQFVNDPIGDFWAQPNIYAFYRYDHIHRLSCTTTQRYAQTMQQIFERDHCKKLFDVRGAFALPFKPLVGIKAPALALEASLYHKNDWERYLEPLCWALETIIAQRKSGA